MRSIRFYIKLAAIAIAATVIIGYSILEARSLFDRDNLIITNPPNGSTLGQELINIEGQASNVASISINGLPLFVDEDGNFTAPYIMAPGYNIIEVALKDKFGRVEK